MRNVLFPLVCARASVLAGMGVGLLLVLLVASSASAGERMFFSFDDVAIPWRHNLRVTLVEAEKHPANPVLRRGPEGSPDHGHALIYGSVLHVDGKFRMWYLGMAQRKIERGQAPGYWRPMCYAESDDGVRWTKPALGLVEFNGSRQNNICLIEAEPYALSRVNDFLTVIHDPDDPDPARRYKTAFIAHVPFEEVRGGRSGIGPHERRWCSAVCATSADGLRWRVVGDRPLNAGAERFEVSGLYRFGDFYYATGQLISPWTWLPDGRDVGRVMLACRSADFKTWSSAAALAFARPGQLLAEPVSGQQTHMGAGLWNRGNVLVGLYGMWQDGPRERPKGASHLWGTRIDLGLIVSNDGIHFREPVADFKVIPRGKEGAWDSIALLQAHAFANVGERTYVWYSHWDCDGLFRNQDIGLATLRRDGFGYLSRRFREQPGHLVTQTFASPGVPRLTVNVEGASEQSPLVIHLLDGLDRPIAGFSGVDVARVTRSGTRQPVVWPRPAGAWKSQPVAIKVEFPGSGDARLYAISVADDLGR